jgi:putative ABC transport system permease protein
METILQDIKYAIRMLVKSPGLTAVAVLSLALGIGANTTIFSWVKAVLLRPIPAVTDPDRLVVFAEKSLSGGYTSTSYPDYVDFRDRNEALSGIFIQDTQTMSLSTGDRADRVFGAIVSGNYFDVLGAQAARGRTFLPEEDRTPGSHPVAVLSHGLWQRKFNSDPHLVGNTVTLNGQQFTVLGVMPEEFVGTFVGLSTDLWVPIMMEERFVAGRDRLTSRGDHWLQAMARLRPGVSIDQARANLEVIAGQLASEYPATNAGRSATVMRVWESPWGAQFVLRPVLIVLTAVVALVLLIACANVANLLLARAIGRRKEIAVRLALGASRIRLIRQLLTESVLLACLGGVGGLAAAFWSSDILMAFVPPTDMPVKLATNLDWHVLGFTLAVSVVTGFVFGLAPALQASNPDLVTALKDESGRVAGGGKGRLRSLLVVAQVALSLVLLVAAALFLQSFRNGHTIDPGFNPDNVMIASYDLFPNGYDTDRGRIFHRQLLQRVEALPGVETATIAHRVPLGFGGSNSTTVRVDGYEPRPNEEMSVEYNNVGRDYFRAMQTPLVEGRDFTAQDDDHARRVLIINETMARRYFLGQSPLGRQVRIGNNGWEVVGVARDGKYRALNEDPRPFMYMPIAQSYRPEAALTVRSSGDPAAMMAAVREAVRQMDANLPLFEVMTIREYMSAAVFIQRIAATLLGLFGGLALLLATIGLYSVMAYSVSQRTHEIGVRLALGAKPRDVLKLVVGHGMRLAIIGVAVGVAAAFGLTGLMSSLLFGVSPGDPLTFGSISLLLVAVALAACYVPARRATRIDPTVALRYQ